MEAAEGDDLALLGKVGRGSRTPAGALGVVYHAFQTDSLT